MAEADCFLLRTWNEVDGVAKWIFFGRTSLRRRSKPALQSQSLLQISIINSSTILAHHCLSSIDSTFLNEMYSCGNYIQRDRKFNARKEMADARSHAIPTYTSSTFDSHAAQTRLCSRRTRRIWITLVRGVRREYRAVADERARQAGKRPAEIRLSRASAIAVQVYRIP